MNEESFKQLWDELVRVVITGSYQRRALVYQDAQRPNLKVFMYKEPNHKRPHVHIYFGNGENVSVCITTREILAGNMKAKLLVPSKLWVERFESELLQSWEAVQLGKSPELLWAKQGTVK